MSMKWNDIIRKFKKIPQSFIHTVQLTTQYQNYTQNEITEKIIGVYHILCINDWQKLVEEQISQLKDSGLYDKTDKLFISCVIKNNSDKELILKLCGKKSEIISINTSLRCYEFPALDFILKKAKNENFKIYYFHTKGITANGQKRINSNAWRNMMQYFIFYKYPTALKILEKYDTYGSLYSCFKTETKRHAYYSGNFWWSKSSYIRNLDYIPQQERANRYLAENWICSKTEKNFCIFNTPVDLYTTNIPTFLYNKSLRFNYILYFKFLLSHYYHFSKKIIQKI